MKNLLLYGPLVLVNMWHGVVLCMAGRVNGLATISESALYRPKVLRTHQIVHCVGAVCFFLFGMQFLAVAPLSGALLMLAAVFDVLEAVWLSEKTNHTPFNLRDTHQLLAWIMASLYMIFAFVLAVQTGLHPGLIIAYAASLMCIALWGSRANSKAFHITEMLFFILTSVFIITAVAHIS